MTDRPLAQQFSDLCTSGQEVDLREFLGQHPGITHDQLVSVLCVHQRQCWERGQPRPAEAYLADFPQLDTDTHAALDLIYHEWHLREERGEQVQSEEYLQRFPGLATELKLQAEIDRLIQQHESQATEAVSHTTRAESISARDSGMAARPRGHRPRHLETLPQLPGYRLLEVLGHGGMGVVYLAWHERLKRKVAVKVIKSNVLSDPAARKRFEAEGRAIARLNQPNIVQIYEVGEHLDQLFLSIEYCAGGSLARHLNGTPLPNRQAAEICRTISLAIHHAHQRGIIHRDLKPANVVLFLPDEQELSDSVQVLQRAIPKVSDFGLARTADEAGQTRTDGMLGTPSYMSPEQARNAVEVTRHSDIYSLGAILYELLTGRPPFKATSMIETIHQVLSDEAVSPRQLVRSLPRDLDTICLKALQKEPARRYDTALELANDLDRFLAGQPVKARPVSSVERLYRWSLRNPGWAAASVSFATMLLVAAFLTWRNIDQAHSSIEQLQRKQTLLEEEQRHTQEEKEKTAIALVTARKSLYSANIARAANAFDSFNLQGMDTFLEQCPRERRSWEWNYLQTLSNRRHDFWKQESASISALAWDPEYQWIATANENGQMTIYDLPTSQLVYQRSFNSGQRVKLDFLEPGGRLIYVEAKYSDIVLRAVEGQIGTVDLADNQAQPTIWHPPADYSISDLAVSQSTRQYAVALIPSASPGSPGVIKLFDAAQQPPVETAEFPMPSVDCRFIEYSPDGKLMAIGGGDHRVFLVDASTRQIVSTIEALSERPENIRTSVSKVDFFGTTQELYEWGNNCFAFSWDGKLLAAGMHSGQVRVWDLTSKKLVSVMQTANDHVIQLAFSQDNHQLAASTITGVIYLFELPMGQQFGALQGHTMRITGMFFDHEKNLVSSSREGRLRLWSAGDRSSNYMLMGHKRSVLTAGFSGDSQTLVTGDGNLFLPGFPSNVRIWNMVDRSSSRVLRLPCGCGALKVDSTGRRFAVGGGDSKVRIFDMQSDQPQVLSGHTASITSLAWHPQANELVSAAGSLASTATPREAIVWDLDKQTPRLTLKGHSAALSSVLYSADGKLIATAGADGQVHLWDSRSGDLIRVLKVKEPILALAIDPLGKWIAGGVGDVMNPIRSQEGLVYIWSLEDGQLLRVLRGHNQLVHSLSVTSDGQRLVSCARNDKIRIWDLESGAQLLTLTPTDYACGVYFSPDGKYLVVPNWSGKIDVYRADVAAEVDDATGSKREDPSQSRIQPAIAPPLAR